MPAWQVKERMRIASKVLISVRRYGPASGDEAVLCGDASGRRRGAGSARHVQRAATLSCGVDADEDVVNGGLG